MYTGEAFLLLEEVGEYSEKKMKGIQLISEKYLNIDGTTLNKVHHNMVVWFFFPGERIQNSNYKIWISENLKSLQEAVEQKLSEKVCFGISRWHYDYEDMYHAYLEAVSALGCTGEKASIVFFSENEKDNISQIKICEISYFLECIMSGDMEQAKNYIGNLLKQWKKQNITEKEQKVHIPRNLRIRSEGTERHSA